MATDSLGRSYPEGEAEFRSWFRSDAGCLDYLDWLRWPGGFVCPYCEDDSWRLADGRHKCKGCKRVVSATAGTIFHGTRTPLTLWFAAAWEMMTSKSGVPALKLQKTLGIGSYQTAWAMLHRYRTVMVLPGRELLTGDVEADETFFGGVKTGGKRGRGSPGKSMVIVAVELRAPKGLGRARLGVIPNAQSATLKPWLEANIAAGSTLITDGLLSYQSATAAAFTHKAINVKGSGRPAHESLPGCHRVMSLFKRWLLSTAQGGISHQHLQSYLDEYAFRFNRRRAHHRGLLFQRLLLQAVQGAPRTYRSLVAVPDPHERNGGVSTGEKRVRPATLELAVSEHPWRALPALPDRS